MAHHKAGQPPTPSQSADKRLCIGKFAGAHGLKGLVKILPFCDDLSLLEGAALFTDETESSTLPGRITLKNSNGKYMLASIETVNNRTDVENLIAAIGKPKLWIARTELPDAGGDDHYIEDLIGLPVIESGKTIGKITGVDNFGAGDLLDITLKTGENFYLPLHDDYVLEIAESVSVQNTKDMIL